MSAIILHKRNTIHCFYSDRDDVVSVTIPPEAIGDTDLRSEQMYQQVVGKMVEKTAGSVIPSILVLADDICYMAQSKPEDVESQRKALVLNTPFAHVETVTLPASHQVYIVATNADIYEAAVRTFSVYGYVIQTVVPWGALTFYRLQDAAVINKESVKRIFDSQSKLKQVAFPVSIPIHVSQQADANKMLQKKTKLPIGWILFGGIATLYAIGMLWFMGRQ